MRRSSMVLCFAALLSACAQESSSPASPGCRMEAAGTCTSAATMTEATCTAQLGTWAAGGCPGGGQVGTCATDAGALVVYYGPLWTAGTAQHACTGTWTPVPAPPAPPAPTGTITVSCTVGGILCIDATGVFTDTSYADFRSCSGTTTQAPCALANAVPGYCEMTTTQPGYAGLAVREYLSAAYYTPATAASTCAGQNDATTTATWKP